MTVTISTLDVISPKRNPRELNDWEKIFPYYAGFPENFSERLLATAKLNERSCILDPWNGSGTTTFTASRLGFPSIGVDLNPVMVIVARARSFSLNEQDSVVPLGREIVARGTREQKIPRRDDPLNQWFGPKTAAWLRNIENAIRAILLGDQTKVGGENLENISAIAAIFYLVIFSICREVSWGYRTSNPTWTKHPRRGQSRASMPTEKLERRFFCTLDRIIEVLVSQRPVLSDRAPIHLRVADTTELSGLDGKVDFVLTSPPYCTRLDYTAATRIQLALLWPLMTISTASLSRKMTGSIRVPINKLSVLEEWGPSCNHLLRNVAQHPSKASSGYYFQTHADYFSKLHASLNAVSKTIRQNGVAVFVAQDSFYKNIHNDLPLILSEMADQHSLHLIRREDYPLRRTLAGRHPHTRNYRTEICATESVLCFRKV